MQFSLRGISPTILAHERIQAEWKKSELPRKEAQMEKIQLADYKFLISTWEATYRKKKIRLTQKKLVFHFFAKNPIAK